MTREVCIGIAIGTSVGVAIAVAVAAFMCVASGANAAYVVLSGGLASVAVGIAYVVVKEGCR